MSGDLQVMRMKEEWYQQCQDRRLQWLGHLGRMEDKRLHKQVLFGELKKKRPCHGVKKGGETRCQGTCKL